MVPQSSQSAKVSQKLFSLCADGVGIHRLPSYVLAGFIAFCSTATSGYFYTLVHSSLANNNHGHDINFTRSNFSTTCAWRCQLVLLREWLNNPRSVIFIKWSRGGARISKAASLVHLLIGEESGAALPIDTLMSLMVWRPHTATHSIQPDGTSVNEPSLVCVTWCAASRWKRGKTCFCFLFLKSPSELLRVCRHIKAKREIETMERCFFSLS